MMQNIIIFVSLIYMLLLSALFIIKLASSSRKGKLSFIKNFKKGKFALIYFAAVPLYYVGLVFNGKSGVESFFSAIKHSIDLIVLKYDLGVVIGLFNANIYFKITILICFCLVALNAFIFTFALIGKSVVNKFKIKKLFVLDKKVHIIIGYNQNNINIAKSIHQECVIFGDMDSAKREELFVNKILYYNFGEQDNIKKILEKKFKNSFLKKEINVIVNTEDDKLNLIYVKQLSDLIESINQEPSLIKVRKGLNVYPFALPDNESAFVFFEEKSKGAIHIINKYKLIAKNFIDSYPITEFMTSEEINTKFGGINSGTKINVAMIGFGKTSQQIFNYLIVDNQLPFVDENGALVHSFVKYKIFDKRNVLNTKNLNHTTFRYLQNLDELEKNKNKYLPLCDKLFDIEFSETDINDIEFKSRLKNTLKSRDKKSFNYIVINIGEDMANLDLAEKILEDVCEWDLQARIFVNITDSKLSEDVFPEEFKNKKNLRFFGDENKIVYNFNSIINEKIESMALSRHLAYIKAKYGNHEKTAAQLESLAAQKWYNDWSQVQRDSNIYACMGLKTKLGLLGFDYNNELNSNVCRADFERKYFEGSKMHFIDNENNKKDIDYDNSVSPLGSIRYNFGVIEHNRWLAYMISCGYIPASIDELLSKSSKELAKKRMHANITTFDGLNAFAELISKSKGISLSEADVVRYDYQILDDAAKILFNSGYTIKQKKLVKEDNYEG